MFLNESLVGCIHLCRANGTRENILTLYEQDCKDLPGTDAGLRLLDRREGQGALCNLAPGSKLKAQSEKAKGRLVGRIARLMSPKQEMLHFLGYKLAKPLNVKYRPLVGELHYVKTFLTSSFSTLPIRFFGSSSRKRIALGHFQLWRCFLQNV
jgi:hypothetical protein